MKKRFCRWLYRLGFARLAYRVSPSVCAGLMAADLAAGIREGLCKK